MKRISSMVLLAAVLAVILGGAWVYNDRLRSQANSPNYLKDSVGGSGKGAGLSPLVDQPGSGATSPSRPGAVPVSDRHECERCGGSGDCQACYPTGSGHDGEHRCSVCDGSGKCFYCNGKGYY